MVERAESDKKRTFTWLRAVDKEDDVWYDEKKSRNGRKETTMARTMEELKMIIGENLVRLRRGVGMTQLQLADKLGYTDKAVSKWECGDAVPDVWVLTRVAQEFNVTVDYLLSPHKEPTEETVQRMPRRRAIITILAALLVWLIATVAFVVSSIAAPALEHMWLLFIYAIPISALVIFILSCVWGHLIPHYIFLSVMLWGAILSVFLSFTIFLPLRSIWMVFLIGIPGQTIIVLWPAITRRRRK